METALKTTERTPIREQFLPYCVPDIGPGEIEEVVQSLESGWITTGPKTKEFERRFQSYVGCRFAVAVNSCTSGLHLALVAAGIGEGDEVITTPLTFCSTANVIVHQRAKPVLADIREEDFNIDPEEIRKKITSRTRAIIPVHIAGQPCDMDAILQIARDTICWSLKMPLTLWGRRTTIG